MGWQFGKVSIQQEWLIFASHGVGWGSLTGAGGAKWPHPWDLDAHCHIGHLGSLNVIPLSIGSPDIQMTYTLPLINGAAHGYRNGRNSWQPSLDTSTIHRTLHTALSVQ